MEISKSCPFCRNTLNSYVGLCCRFRKQKRNFGINRDSVSGMALAPEIEYLLSTDVKLAAEPYSIIHSILQSRSDLLFVLIQFVRSFPSDQSSFLFHSLGTFFSFLARFWCSWLLRPAWPAPEFGHRLLWIHKRLRLNPSNNRFMSPDYYTS